jgi:shikimate kinase
MIRAGAMTIYLQASFDTIWSRISGIANRPIAARSTREQLEALLEKRRPRYAEADHTVDANRPLDDVAKEVLRLWSG